MKHGWHTKLHLFCSIAFGRLFHNAPSNFDIIISRYNDIKIKNQSQYFPKKLVPINYNNYKEFNFSAKNKKQNALDCHLNRSVSMAKQNNKDAGDFLKKSLPNTSLPHSPKNMNFFNMKSSNLNIFLLYHRILQNTSAGF